MKFKYIVIVVAIFIGVKGYCANNEVIADSCKLRAYTCDTLVFLGLDFSQFYLLNENKLNQGNKLKEVYAPVWLEKLGDDYDERRLQKLFDVDIFIYAVDQFQNRQLSLANPDKMVSAEQKRITLEQLQLIISDYIIEQHEGVGVSLVIEEFNKPMEEVSIIFTFFDLKTKRILYAVRSFGEAGTYGMELHWRTGLTSAMYEFMVNKYHWDRKKMIKQNKKNNH